MDKVLVTGIGGFIARHVARTLLEAGYAVRGTVREAKRGPEIARSIASGGRGAADLTFAEADLTIDARWNEAAEGCRFVIHTASPFPQSPPSDRNALIPVAEGGTRRVMTAAANAGVERVVLTSSVVAVYHGNETQSRHYTEADWTDTDSPQTFSYAMSKTMAERLAWQMAADMDLPLAVLNPALVLGPPSSREYGTSLRLIEAMMKGRLPVVPAARFGVVDVRDVADAHLAAMVSPEAAGKRFILSGGSLDLIGMGAAIASHRPAFASRMPRWILPRAVLQVAAFVSPAARMLLAEVGRERSLETAAALNTLGIVFRSAEDAVAAAADALVENGAVREPRAG